MVRRLCAFAVVAAGLLTAGCSSDDDSQVSLAGARQAVDAATSSTCPLHLDVPAALKSAGITTTVTLDSTEAQKSKTDQPAEDPVAAQQGGLSAIDASAGVYVECDYKGGADEIAVRVVVMPGKGALNLLLPQLSADADLTAKAIEPIAANPPAAGEVQVVGDTVGIGGLAVDGGSGAIMVTSELPDVAGDKLTAVTKALLGQVRT